jgi:metal-responsive CopG/Arc/MetJ family transcriptional regulator
VQNQGMASKVDDTVVISVRVTRDLLTRFDRLADKHRRKRGDLARIVLEDWVAEQEKAEKNEKQKK